MSDAAKLSEWQPGFEAWVEFAKPLLPQGKAQEEVRGSTNYVRPLETDTQLRRKAICEHAQEIIIRFMGMLLVAIAAGMILSGAEKSLGNYIEEKAPAEVERLDQDDLEKKAATKP